MATPEGNAKIEDPARSNASEEAEIKPLGKRPPETEINGGQGSGLLQRKRQGKEHVDGFSSSTCRP